MPISLWLDGCFDGFHYAHANAVRQALFLIDGERNPRIFAGVHSDNEILRNKGPPLFDEAERYNALRGCRWIDEVVENVPYITSSDVILNYNIDYVVHGDDIVLDAEGNDCYGAFRKTGKYKECKRTEGISTTSLIQRILQPNEWALAQTEHARLQNLMELFVAAVPYTYHVIPYEILSSKEDYDVIRRCWPTQRRVVYIGGSWDCFGAGHVEFLRRAKTIAEDVILVVGIWSDQVVQARTGQKPLLALLERALAIVQCKYSDALILSPSIILPPRIVDSLDIEMIINSEGVAEQGMRVKHMNVEEPPLQSVSSLRQKLLSQRDLYEERQKRKGGCPSL